MIRTVLALSTLVSAGLGIGVATRDQPPPPPVATIAAAATVDDSAAGLRERWHRDSVFLQAVRTHGGLLTEQHCPPGAPCIPSGGDLLNTAAALCTLVEAGATHDELIAFVAEQYPGTTTPVAEFFTDESLRTQCTTSVS